MQKPTILLLILLWAGLLGSKASPPEEALREFLKAGVVDNDEFALYIWDIDSEMQVVAHRPKMPIVPASVMKCVTTAALSQSYPYTTRITTDVFLDGGVVGGKLTGNIVVTGAGDPSLGCTRHKDQPDFIKTIVEALQQRGVKEIDGSIEVENDFFAGPATHPTWSSMLEHSYATGVHAFNFRGNAEGSTAVSHPENVFKNSLSSALRDAGILYTHTSDMGIGRKNPLLEYNSPPLSELMRSCMFRSDNLYAETFLRLFGISRGGDGSFSSSARKAMEFWDSRDLSVDAIEIADGSGLSRQNRLTAEFLGEVLKSMQHDPYYVSFFPLVGEEGTVGGFLKNTDLQGYMALKTGSMTGIQSYAGYVLDEDFVPTHVVVAIANGLRDRDAYRKALSKLFLEIFK